MSNNASYIEVGAVDDVPVRGARIVQLGGAKIAIFRTINDEVFAIDDKCPHQQGPLSQGIVHARKVTCPLHNLMIDLGTGKVDGPDGGCVATYPVEVREGRIFLSLSVNAEEKVA